MASAKVFLNIVFLRWVQSRFGTEEGEADIFDGVDVGKASVVSILNCVDNAFDHSCMVMFT